MRLFLSVANPLGAGTLPQEGDDLIELLEAASELGDELNSAFIPAKSQPGLATAKF